MAASDEPCPSSPSESDSEKEPNSHGARVFWGNLKTPEKSRSVFVDPPQTVIRTQRTLHTQSSRESTGLSPSVQDNRSSQNLVEESGTLSTRPMSSGPSSLITHVDESLDSAHSNNNTMSEVSQAQEKYDVAHPHLQYDNDTGETPSKSAHTHQLTKLTHL